MVVVYSIFRLKQYRLRGKRQAISQWVGRPFPALPVVDSAGKTASLELQPTGITIIDCWFSTCPACIAEMSQYAQLIGGKEGQVSILSLSIDPMDQWKFSLAASHPDWLFFSRPVKNWRHLRLNFDTQSPKNNAEQLHDVLAVSSYPAYFVLDPQGIILATPVSAVDYLHQQTAPQNAWLLFLRDASTWRSWQTLVMILLTVVGYQILYSLISKRKRA